jgi:hypothetical protein
MLLYFSTNNLPTIMASRITAKTVDSALESFNTMLNLPTEYGEQGHVFLQQQNGYNNIYQQEGPGCRGLAYGLTMREAYEWVAAAMQGIQMAKGMDTSR